MTAETKSKKIGSATASRAPAEAWVHVTPAELASFQKEHGLSQSALTKHLRVSSSRLKAWLAGEKIASSGLQVRLRAALGRKPGEPEPAPKPKALEELLAYLGRTRITQAELARRLGVNKTTVSAWTSGTGAPSVATQKKIRAFLREEAAAQPAPAVGPGPGGRAPLNAGRSVEGSRSANQEGLKAKLLELLQASIASSGAQVAPADLPALIREMRAALE